MKIANNWEGNIMRTSLLLTALFSFATIVPGCITTEYTLYLQDVNVTGPISQPPVHITSDMKEKPLRITPHIAINPAGRRDITGQIDGHSKVDRNGIYQVDTIRNSDNTVLFRERTNANRYAFNGKNLIWKTPAVIVGANFDFTIGNHIALSLGTSYSSESGNGLWGYSAGLGFFSEAINFAFRVDAGIHWQTLAYEAYTAVVEKELFSNNSEQRVGFFRDNGTVAPMGFYASLTYNTTHQEWFTNFFLQLCLSKQALADFKPELQNEGFLFPFFQQTTVVHDARANYSSTIIGITPGIYMQINHSAKLIAGLHFYVQTQIIDSSPGTIIVPSLMFEWSI
jgi:hypothetical protein